jgi:hypothetical protein
MNHSPSPNRWTFLKTFSWMMVKGKIQQMRKDRRRIHLILTR